MSSKSESREVRRPRLRRRAATPAALLAVAAVALVGVAAIALGSWALSATGDPGKPARRVAAATPTVEPTATVTPGMVEVPALTGLSLDEAETVLAAAGMAVQVRAEDPSASGGVDTVVDQEPEAGVLADAATTVVLVVRSSAPTVTPPSPPKESEPKRSAYVVVIDPGHQARSNSAPEPIGPGAKEVKPKVTGGATGVKTRIPEYEIVLQISMNLKKRLEAQGVKVVMTRSTNDVNLPNSERADTANRAKADLFVRVHADGSPESKTAGMSTLYPGKNRWTKADRRRVEASCQDDSGSGDRRDRSGGPGCRRPTGSIGVQLCEGAVGPC